MKLPPGIVCAALVIILTSCNLPAGTMTPLPSPEPVIPSTGQQTPTVPAETLPAPLQPTVKPSPTPAQALAFPKEQPVNCRFGPGTSYAVIGELKPGRSAELIGKNIDVSWWYVKNPSDPSTTCWLAASFIRIEGYVEALPVVDPPLIGVTAIGVRIEPPDLNIGCSAFPQFVTIIAEITTNGPANVLWRWEEVGTGEVAPEKSLLFESGGTRTVQATYQVKSARDYIVVVRSLQPNEVTGTANFKALCIP